MAAYYTTSLAKTGSLVMRTSTVYCKLFKAEKLQSQSSSVNLLVNIYSWPFTSDYSNLAIIVRSVTVICRDFSNFATIESIMYSKNIFVHTS